MVKFFQYSWLRKMQLLKCIKGSFWEQPSAVNMLTALKHYWNLHKSTFILWLIRDELSWRISPLLRSIILGPFVKTFSAHGKCSRHYRENLAQPVQIQSFRCVSNNYINFEAVS